MFFIHSPVDGHLGCFHVLAIVNSAAMDTGVHVSFKIRVFVFFRYLPRSRFVGSYWVCLFVCLFVLGNFMLFSIVAAQIYWKCSLFLGWSAYSLCGSHLWDACLQLKYWGNFKIQYLGSSCYGSVEMNLTGIHEDTGLIPGLVQWVKDPVLQWAVIQVEHSAWIWHCCGCGIGQQI